MVKRVIVGAHYGTRGWLAQRITALVMALYTPVALYIFLSRAPWTYEAWKAFFAQGWVRIATLPSMLSFALEFDGAPSSSSPGDSRRRPPWPPRLVVVGAPAL